MSGSDSGSPLLPDLLLGADVLTDGHLPDSTCQVTTNESLKDFLQSGHSTFSAGELGPSRVFAGELIIINWG